MAKIQKELKIKILIFSILTILICSSFFFYNSCEQFINKLFFPEPIQNTKQCDLRVHYIDIGQGDGILIELPDNKTMLIDCGPKANVDDLMLYLNKIYINKSKVIDYFVLTHSDGDHIGGAKQVFDNFEVKNCYRPNVYTNQEILENNYNGVGVCNEESYIELIEKIKQEHCNVFVNIISDNLFNLDENCGYKIKAIAPFDEMFESNNDYSSVLMLEYNNKKYMFTGDTTTYTEEKLVSLYKENLKVDVLKVGHHGSNTSSCFNFLKYTNPTYAVISTGKNNPYNHPNDKVLSRLKGFVKERNILRTDVNGNIIIGQTGEKIIVETQKNRLAEIHIHYWCVVVFLEGLIYLVIFEVFKSKTAK